MKWLQRMPGGHICARRLRFAQSLIDFTHHDADPMHADMRYIPLRPCTIAYICNAFWLPHRIHSLTTHASSFVEPKPSKNGLRSDVPLCAERARHGHQERHQEGDCGQGQCQLHPHRSWMHCGCARRASLVSVPPAVLCLILGLGPLLRKGLFLLALRFASSSDAPFILCGCAS